MKSHDHLMCPWGTDGRSSAARDQRFTIFRRSEEATPQLGPLWIGRMAELKSETERVAQLMQPVLVLGETGTGKEVIARHLHLGRSRHAPLRSLNCGALPASLLEGILFGCERGAFTGADRARAGVFEDAADGSVFLDEIGELSLQGQAALLRVLEAKTVTRLGGARELPVKARVIAATHRNLQALVGEGRFREDLYHRLSTFVIAVPPLRSRRDEIAYLAARFIGLALREVGRDILHVDSGVFEALSAADWPGNVRELRNVVLRSVAMCRTDVLVDRDLRWNTNAPDLDAASAREPRSASAPSFLPRRSLRIELRGQELQAIRAALERTNGHKGRAADLLGLPIRTFRRRLRDLEQSSVSERSVEAPAP